MTATDQPNIVLILTDTQGLNAVGDVGGTGSGVVNTPNIDALADDGVSCSNMYAGAPVCGPSRACLFTGNYPHRAGGWANSVLLYDGIQTMGEYFAEAGYRTAYVGKWHLDGDYFGDGVAPDPYEQEYWYDGQTYREDMGDEFFEWWWNGMNVHDNGEHPPEALHERGITREDVWAGRIVDRARAFLEDVGSDEPYFLVVSIDEPHEPSLCPPEFAERYVDDLPPLPDNYETADELQDKPEHHQMRARDFRNGEFFIDSLSNPESGVIPRPVYFGCAEFVDDEIGKLIEAIDTRDRDNTVVSFTSDHGHHLGAHGLDSKWATMYEETVNVPFVVRYPNELPAGERRDGIASQVDVLTTLVDLAGIEDTVTLDVDGESMRPLLADGTPYRDAALIEYQAFSAKSVGADGIGFFPIRARVTESEKLVINLLGSDEYYDLTKDPGEKHNRITDPDAADDRDRMHQSLIDDMESLKDPFRGTGWERRDWQNT